MLINDRKRNDGEIEKAGLIFCEDNNPVFSKYCVFLKDGGRIYFASDEDVVDKRLFSEISPIRHCDSCGCQEDIMGLKNGEEIWAK